MEATGLSSRLARHWRSVIHHPPLFVLVAGRAREHPSPLFSFLLCRWLEAVNSVSFPVVLKGEPLSPTNFSPKVMFDPSFAGHIERCSLGLFMRARRDPVQPA